MMKITFAYNHAIEAVSSALRYANLTEYQKQLKGFGYKISPGMIHWLDWVESEISGFLEDEVKELLSDSYLNALFMQDLAIKRNIETAYSLTKALKACSAQDYLAYVYEYLQLESDAPESEIQKALLDTHSKKSVEKIMEQLRNPQETLERLSFSLSKFSERFFEPLFWEEEKILQERVEYFRKKYEAAPEKFFQKVIGTKLFGFSGDAEVRVMVSHFHEASLALHDYPEKKLYVAIMGYQIESILSEEAIGKKRIELFKVLSDEKRLQILKMTCQKKCYGNELAKELKITTATLSYHISKLFELGVMSIEDGETNRIYYRADKEKLHALMERIYNDIVGNEEKQ